MYCIIVIVEEEGIDLQLYEEVFYSVRVSLLEMVTLELWTTEARC